MESKYEIVAEGEQVLVTADGIARSRLRLTACEAYELAKELRETAWAAMSPDDRRAIAAAENDE